MDLVIGFAERIQTRVFGDLDAYKFIRLVIIIGGYIFLRNRVSDYLKQKQLKEQIIRDKQMREEKLINDPTGEIERAANEDLFAEHEGISNSEKAWGWGKATRRKVAKQKALFEQEIERAAIEAQSKLQKGYDSDEEINEFLQD